MIEKVKLEDFPIHLALEMREDYYFRIVYLDKHQRLYWGAHCETLYEYELYNYELKKNQKKMIVKHVMKRLKYRFSFDLSDEHDRFYVKRIYNVSQLKQELKEIYIMLDQQIGIEDISKPTEFFK